MLKATAKERSVVLDATHAAADRIQRWDHGALWEDIVNDCAQRGVAEGRVDDAMSDLLEMGIVTEPIVGIIVVR